MSDVFYLNLPRSRGLRNGVDINNNNNNYNSSDMGYTGTLIPESLPSSNGSPVDVIGWRALPVAVGVMTIGCAISIAIKMWKLRKQRDFTAAERREQLQMRIRQQRRRVYHAGMEGIPSPRVNNNNNIKKHHHHNNNNKNDQEENLDNVMEKKAGSSSSSSSSSSLLLESPQDSFQVFVTATGEKYRRVSQLGRGGFGTVFKCINLNSGQLIAVKEVPLGKSHDNNSNAEELRSEFELLSNIEHPNIIRLISYHVGHQHARLFLEWAAGGSLYNMMKHVSASSSSTGLHESLVRSYIQQIISALHCLHNHGIIHRDLKPQNILVDHSGMLRLTDFGLSRLLNDEASAVETGVAGTPRYMAPETILSGRFSYGSDIWAVGAIMSELFTGKLPWSHLQLLTQQQQQSSLSILGSKQHFVQPIPALLCYICTHPEEHPIIPDHISSAAREFMKVCFHADPKDRGTAAELLEHPFLKQERTDGNMGKPQNRENVRKVGEKEGRENMNEEVKERESE